MPSSRSRTRSRSCTAPSRTCACRTSRRACTSGCRRRAARRPPAAARSLARPSREPQPLPPPPSQAACTAHIERSIEQLQNQTPDALAFLSLIHGCWSSHCEEMLTLRSIFLYLDRTYVMQTSRRSLWEMGLSIFREHLTQRPEVGVKVRRMPDRRRPPRLSPMPPPPIPLAPNPIAPLPFPSSSLKGPARDARAHREGAARRPGRA